MWALFLCFDVIFIAVAWEALGDILWWHLQEHKPILPSSCRIKPFFKPTCMSHRELWIWVRQVDHTSCNITRFTSKKDFTKYELSVSPSHQRLYRARSDATAKLDSTPSLAMPSSKLKQESLTAPESFSIMATETVESEAAHLNRMVMRKL